MGRREEREENRESCGIAGEAIDEVMWNGVRTSERQNRRIEHIHMIVYMVSKYEEWMKRQK